MKTRKSEFATRVHKIVQAIPQGTVRTYAQVAQLAGHPGAARAVGTLMKHNCDPTIPCHRVVRSDGTVGEYNRGGPSIKRRLLEAEGGI